MCLVVGFPAAARRAGLGALSRGDGRSSTPVLEISEGYRAGAVCVGAVLMLRHGGRAAVRAGALEADRS